MPLTAAQIPPQIEALETVRDIVLTMHSTMIGIYDQMDELSANSTAMGKAFDTANNDDSFYLPPRGVHQRELQTHNETISIPRRACGSVHYFAPWRPRQA
nr:hypothetical protein [Mycobacterium marinum]